MRFHIGLSINWKTIKKWIIPIVLGILVFLGYSSANAATLTDTTSWMIVETFNNSTTAQARANCSPWTDSYDGNDYCMVYPDDYVTSVRFTGRVTVQPYEFKANNTYKIVINTVGVFPTNFTKANVYFELYSGGYSSAVSFSSISGTNINSWMQSWVLTFKPTQDYSAKTFAITFISPSQFGGDGYGMFENFEIIEVDNTNDVIIDQNETIIDQNEETNKQLGDLNEKQDEIKDSITDSTVEEGTGNNFFNNFNTEDNGGISGIVTAPLDLIKSLLDNQGSCTDLSFEVWGKEVALPSGCLIWDEVPSSIEIVLQTLFCGPCAYYLLTKLFKDVNNLKDPNKSEVSTLDL